MSSSSDNQCCGFGVESLGKLGITAGRKPSKSFRFDFKITIEFAPSSLLCCSIVLEMVQGGGERSQVILGLVWLSPLVA
jgi:hypothetical protein